MFRYKALKVREDDATLPRTRKELFKTVLKDDFYLLAELSVFAFLFSLPLALGFLAEFILLGGISEITSAKVFSLCLYAGLAEIPLFGVRYIGRYAVFGVMKKRVHNESGDIKGLFFEFLKKGAGRGFVVGCVLGAAQCLWQVASVFVVSLNAEPVMRGVGFGAAALFFLIIFAMCESTLAVDHYYALPLRSSFKNGFSFALAGFPWAALYFVVSMVVPLVLTFLSRYAIIALAAVWAVWFDAVTVLVVTLYSHRQFDKYINSIYYIDYINKGLMKEKEKDNG